MEVINPIEGVGRDPQGQESALAEVVRENYWKQRAQKAKVVEASTENTKTAGKGQNQSRERSEPQITTRQTYAEFEIDKETHEILVRIFDAESGELVRSIPPEKLAEEIAKGKLYPNQLRRRAVFA